MGAIDILGGSTRKKVATNTLAQVVGKGLTATTSLFVSAVIARRFGTDGYGDFSKITTFVAFFFLLVDFGINAIYLQEDRDAGSPTGKQKLWQTLLGLRLGLGLLLMALAILILTFLPTGVTQGYTPFVRLGILIFLPTILFQGLITSGNAVFQKSLRYDLATIAIAVGSFVSIALMTMAFFSNQPNTGVLLGVSATLLGTIGTALVGIWLTKPLTHTILPHFQWKAMLGLFLNALPLGLILLCNLVYFRADSVVLTLTRTTSEVGIYGLAYKVFELPLVIPTFFMNSLYPIFLVSERKHLGRLISKSVGILLVTSLVVTAGLWLSAPLLPFIQQDFAQAIPALRILSLGLPFFFLSSLTMWALISLRKQALLFGIYGLSMVGNVLANIIWIPTHGYLAAAWITVVSEGVVLLVSGLVLLYSWKVKR